MTCFGDSLNRIVQKSFEMGIISYGPHQERNKYFFYSFQIIVNYVFSIQGLYSSIGQVLKIYKNNLGILSPKLKRLLLEVLMDGPDMNWK